MVLKRAEWPIPDEFAIAVATKVANYGAYVVLPEFGEKEGFIHISEISSTWVRNIRNHIQENQRVVVKVLKVDTDTELALYVTEQRLPEVNGIPIGLSPGKAYDSPFLASNFGSGVVTITQRGHGLTLNARAGDAAAGGG